MNPYGFPDWYLAFYGIAITPVASRMLGARLSYRGGRLCRVRWRK